jgi:ribosomal protein S6
MPATEAISAPARTDDERTSYEFAFHVLPTVAEGEVAGVFDALKTLVAKAGGEIFDEEAPQHLELAYDVVRHLEGKNRAFHSAYFGWVRFRLDAEKLAGLTESIEARPDILRYLIVKLTRQEEAAPFRYHEAQKERKVRTVEEREIPTARPRARKEQGEVSDEKLDESLERIAEDADVKEESDTIEETGEKQA